MAYGHQLRQKIFDATTGAPYDSADDVLYLAPGFKVRKSSVQVYNSTSGTIGVGTLVASDDGNGNIVGTGLTASTIDYDTGDVHIQEDGTDVFLSGEDCRIDYWQEAADDDWILNYDEYPGHPQVRVYKDKHSKLEWMGGNVAVNQGDYCMRFGPDNWDRNMVQFYPKDPNWTTSDRVSVRCKFRVKQSYGERKVICVCPRWSGTSDLYSASISNYNWPNYVKLHDTFHATNKYPQNSVANSLTFPETFQYDRWHALRADLNREGDDMRIRVYYAGASEADVNPGTSEPNWDKILDVYHIRGTNVPYIVDSYGSVSGSFYRNYPDTYGYPCIVVSGYGENNEGFLWLDSIQFLKG